ncbi:hypothetical protein BD769DRAFT_1391142 [Suillus cothurnatus]|nr:hypothetical protein BD769DRAFT_1391142 [Suillus cothurnatus]
MVCDPTLVPKNSDMPQCISAKPVVLHVVPKDSPRVKSPFFRCRINVVFLVVHIITVRLTKKKQQSSKSDDEKRKLEKKEAKSDQHEEYLTAARCITQCVDMFCKINKVIDISMLLKQSQKTHDRYQQNYKHLLELEPGLKPLIASSKDLKKASELRKIVQKQSKSWFPLSMMAVVDTHIWVTIERLQGGKICMKADAFPAFLWNGDLPGVNYDPDNMMDGFLDGFILKHTMRHIFTGPSTVYGAQSHGTHPSNATLHAMTTVEPPHIVYGCVQVRFGISSRNTWTEEDGDFNYHNFYCYIIELIDDLPDNDKERLLKGWNLKLFKNENGHDVAKDNADEVGALGAHKGGSNLARLCAQMAACNAAVKTHTLDSECPVRTLPTRENSPPPPRTPPPSLPAHNSPHHPTQSRHLHLLHQLAASYVHVLFHVYEASCVESIGHPRKFTSTPSTTTTITSSSSTASISPSKDSITSQWQLTWQ